MQGGGLRNTEAAYLLFTQQPQVRFSPFPIIFLLMLLIFIDGTAGSSGQILDNVNQTYVVPASGKLVIQKKEQASETTDKKFKSERLAGFVFSPSSPFFVCKKKSWQKFLGKSPTRQNTEKTFLSSHEMKMKDENPPQRKH